MTYHNIITKADALGKKLEISLVLNKIIVK